MSNAKIAKESSPAYVRRSPERGASGASSASSANGANGERHVRLFRNGTNQAVRIPKEFELPGVEALMLRDGDRLILQAILPVHKIGSPAALLALLDQWAAEGPVGDPGDDAFADIDAGLLKLDDIVLGDPAS